MRILVTGGAGYIGSHTVLRLLERGHEVHVIDDLSNSSAVALQRVSELAGKPAPLTVGDVRDRNLVDELMSGFSPEAVVHFAGLKAVGESVVEPLRYWEVNLGTTTTLLNSMDRHNVRRLVFSSSATVYGTPQSLPILETDPVGVGISNPYGQTKFVIERMLADLAGSPAPWEFVSLRYFNPIGAHESGRIGEDPRNIPNNLAPYDTQVPAGPVGWPTVIGTQAVSPAGAGLCDDIHVIDLADGHLAALENCQPGFAAVNLGTGHGTSVLELVSEFEKAANKKVPLNIVGRRSGDVESCYADATKALDEWGWQAQKSIAQACADAWHWQSQNPHGFA